MVGLGEELWIRYLPRYLEYLGAGVGGVAIYGALYNLLDSVYQYPGGWLADRLGRRSALTIFTLMAGGGYLIYLGASHWWWILAGTVLVMAWDTLTLPVLFSTIGDNLPPERRATGFGLLSILRRIPIIIAPPLGGLMIMSWGLEEGMEAGLGITVVLTGLGAWVVWRFYRELPRPPGPPLKVLDVWRSLDRRLKRLLVADILARWAEGIPRVFVVIYVTDRLGQPEWVFGLLLTSQRVVNVLGYLPLARLSDRMNRRPFVLATFAFFALFPLVLANVAGLPGLVVAFVVAGLWEVGEPARKALIVDRAGESMRGRAIGLYYLLRNLSIVPASLVGGLLWNLSGPPAMFYAAFAAGAAGFLFYAFWDKE